MLGIKAPFGEPFLYAPQPMSKLMPENGAKKRVCRIDPKQPTPGPALFSSTNPVYLEDFDSRTVFRHEFAEGCLTGAWARQMCPPPTGKPPPSKARQAVAAA